MDLTADDLKELVGTFKKIYEENEGRPFPQDPRDQLIEAVKAVFRSWDNPRANVYRKMNEIPYEWGHRCQRAADGIRQLRRPFRHRRCIHP